MGADCRRCDSAHYSDTRVYIQMYYVIVTSLYQDLGVGMRDFSIELMF